ncbi:MAG: NUDIX domain-containing protein [Anaerolineae bacterium]|nr:NUDIX domain-containing protein [Anaerolineae bacterium]
MTSEEFFDIYDDNLVKIGVKRRSQVHRDGDWHRSFHCWVIYRDTAAKDWILLQKRAPDKDTYPDLFDISCAGHYSAGEDLATTALRELDEELGLKIEFEELIRIGLRIATKKPSPDMIDREISDVFLLINDQPLTAYQTNDELTGLARLGIEDALALCAGEHDEITAEYLSRGEQTITTIKFRLTDFVPTFDHYFYRLLVVAKRCLNGDQQHLVI